MANFWLYLAFGASILWGFAYALSEKILKTGVSPAFAMVVSTIVVLPLYVAFAISNGSIKSGIQALSNSSTALWMLVVMAVCIAAGNLLIYQSISIKNATLASMIEITYPLFTFIFAWLIMGQVQLTVSTAFGALLIFAGVAVMFFKG